MLITEAVNYQKIFQLNQREHTKTKDGLASPIGLANSFVLLYLAKTYVENTRSNYI